MSRKKKGAGTWAHGCPICHQRYEQRGQLVRGPRGGEVGAPRESGPCLTCRTDKPLPWWPHARLPRDCCRAHSRPARKEEMQTYNLAADCVWFICTVCSRTFPYRDPTKETDDELAARTESQRAAWRERQGITPERA